MSSFDAQSHAVVKEGWVYLHRHASLLRRVLQQREGSSSPRYMALLRPQQQHKKMTATTTASTSNVSYLVLWEQRSDAKAPFSPPLDTLELHSNVKIESADNDHGSNVPSRRNSVMSYATAQSTFHQASTKDTMFSIVAAKGKKWRVSCGSAWEREEWINAIQHAPVAEAPINDQAKALLEWNAVPIILDAIPFAPLSANADKHSNHDDDDVYSGRRFRDAIDNDRLLNATTNADMFMAHFQTAAARAVSTLIDASRNLVCSPEVEYKGTNGVRMRFVMDYDGADVCAGEVHGRVRRELRANECIRRANIDGVYPVLMTVVEYRGFWMAVYGTPDDGKNAPVSEDDKQRIIASLNAVGGRVRRLHDNCYEVSELVVEEGGEVEAIESALEACACIPVDSREWRQMANPRALSDIVTSSRVPPQLRDAALCELLARTVKTAMRPALRAATLNGTGCESIIREVSTVNAVDLLPSLLAKYTLSVDKGTLAGLPPAVLASAIRFHCQIENGAVYAKPVDFSKDRSITLLRKDQSRAEMIDALTALLSRVGTDPRGECDRIAVGIVLYRLNVADHSRMLSDNSWQSAVLSQHPHRFEAIREHFGSADHPLAILLRLHDLDNIHSSGHNLGSGQQALSSASKSLGRAHPLTRSLVIRLADMYAAEGARLEEALEFYQDALRSARLYGPLTHGNVAELHLKVARVQEARDEIEGALAAAQAGLTNANGNAVEVRLMEVAARSAIRIYVSQVHEPQVIVSGEYILLSIPPKPLPMLTEGSRAMLSTTLHLYERLLHHSSSPTLAKQVVGIRIRLSQGSQRILLDSLSRHANASSSVSLSSDFCERTRVIVEGGSGRDLADLMAFACTPN